MYWIGRYSHLPIPLQSNWNYKLNKIVNFLSKRSKHIHIYPTNPKNTAKHSKINMKCSKICRFCAMQGFFFISKGDRRVIWKRCMCILHVTLKCFFVTSRRVINGNRRAVWQTCNEKTTLAAQIHVVKTIIFGKSLKYIYFCW